MRASTGKPIRLSLAAALLLLGGCTTAWHKEQARTTEAEIHLDDADFTVDAVHVVSRVTKDYLFFIRIKGPLEARSEAWRLLREKARIEGRPALFVNVTEETTKRDFIFPLYYEQVYTVSADVITFD